MNKTFIGFLFYLLYFVNTPTFGQFKINFPEVFPSEFMNKKLCGIASTTGKMLNGSTVFLDIPVELYISEIDGVFIRYNPGDKFSRDEWGTSTRLTNFDLIKTEESKDGTGRLIGKTFYYQVPQYDVTSQYNISEFYIYDFYGSNLLPASKNIYVKVFVKSYKPATISTNNPKISICETLKTQEERNKETEFIINKINVELELGNIEGAIKEYQNLSIPDSKTKNLIQTKINSLNTIENKTLTTNQITSIINENFSAIQKITNGLYNLTISKSGEINLVNQQDTSKIFLCKNNKYLTMGDFIMPYTLDAELTISETKQKIHNDSARFIFSEKFKRKTLYVSKKGDFYFNKFGAPLNAKMLKHPQYIDEGIKKYDVNVEYLYQYKKVANGIVLSSKERWEQEKVIKAKKGTGRKIVRILLSPIWGPFYLLYLSSYYKY